MELIAVHYSVDDIDEYLLNSTPIQVSQRVSGSTDKNSSQLFGGNKRSIKKIDTSGSKKNSKRKNADIQSYFMNSGIKFHAYTYICMMFIVYAMLIELFYQNFTFQHLLPSLLHVCYTYDVRTYIHMYMLTGH